MVCSNGQEKIILCCSPGNKVQHLTDTRHASFPLANSFCPLHHCVGGGRGHNGVSFCVVSGTARKHWTGQSIASPKLRATMDMAVGIQGCPATPGCHSNSDIILIDGLASMQLIQCDVNTPRPHFEARDFAVFPRADQLRWVASHALRQRHTTRTARPPTLDVPRIGCCLSRSPGVMQRTGNVMYHFKGNAQEKIFQ